MTEEEKRLTEAILELGIEEKGKEQKIKALVQEKLEELVSLRKTAKGLKKDKRVLTEKVFWMSWFVVAFGVPLTLVVYYWAGIVGTVTWQVMLTFLVVILFLASAIVQALMAGIEAGASLNQLEASNEG